MKWLTETTSGLINLSILLLRLTIGIVLFGIGAGKVLKWFGGFGMEMTIKYYGMSGISAPFAYLSSYAEFIGGFLLIIGLFTRPAAFAIFINMLVATIVTMPKGFLMGGASFPFSFMIISLVIILTGPMKYSIDNMFLRRGEVIRDVQRRAGNV